MSRRGLFVSILMAFLAIASFGALVPAANAAPAGQSLLKAGEIAQNNVTKIGYRHRGPVMYLPMGPTYRYYDYPYYYSRGYYPTHIGPRYYYYGPQSYYRSSYRRSDYPSQGRRCSYWHRQCAANWGAENEDYYGCMQYHGCQ